MGDKGQYGYIRKPEEKPKKVKKKSVDTPEENAVAGSSKDELAFLSQAFVIPPSSLVGAMPGAIPGANIPPLLPVPTPVPVMHSPNTIGGLSSIPISPEVLAARQNATEEEDDEGEWQIGESNEPPPSWAKRKAPTEEEEDVQGQAKRPRQVLQ